MKAKQSTADTPLCNRSAPSPKNTIPPQPRTEKTKTTVPTATAAALLHDRVCAQHAHDKKPNKTTYNSSRFEW